LIDKRNDNLKIQIPGKKQYTNTFTIFIALAVLTVVHLKVYKELLSCFYKSGNIKYAKAGGTRRHETVRDNGTTYPQK